MQQTMAFAAVLPQFIHWWRSVRLTPCVMNVTFPFGRGGQVFVSSHVFLCFMCVCPAHPPPFKPPFTMTIAACWDPFPSIALTTAGYWQGPIHCCNPSQTIKTLVRSAITHLLCLPAIVSVEGGRVVKLLGLCTWFCQRWKRRGLVLCTQ